MKLNTKINIPIIIFVVFIIFINSLIVIHTYKESLKKHIDLFLLSSTRDLEKYMTFYINSIMQQTILLANSVYTTDLIEKSNYNDLDKYLKKLANENQFIKNVSVANENGIIISSSDKNNINENIKEKSYMENLILNNDILYTNYPDIEILDTTNTLVFPIAVELKNKNNNIIGYFILMIDISNYLFFETLDNENLKNKDTISFLKNDGTIIIYQDPKYLLSNTDTYSYFNKPITGAEKSSYGTFEYTIKESNKKNIAKLAAYTKMRYGSWYIISSVDKRSMISNNINNIREITLIIMVITALILIIFIYLLLDKLVIKRLGNIFNQISKMKEGDLVSQLNVKSNDEIGEISKNLNYFINNFRDVISIILANTRDMETSGILLYDVISTTNNEIGYIDKKIELVKNKISEQVDTTDSVILIITKTQKEIVELHELIEIQTEKIKKSSEMIEMMIKKIQEMTDFLENESASSFDQLRVKTSKGEKMVNDIVELINDISDKSNNLINTNDLIKNIAGQTNFLSMNASIEAAHAADFGVGFSVVADEIRKLSEDTRSNSKLIGKWLTEVKDQIKEAVDFSEETREAFVSVMNTVETVDYVSRVIRSNIKDQSLETANILQMLGETRTIANEVFNKAENMTESNITISQAITKLNDLTNLVKNSMVHIRDKSSFVLNSTNEINILSEQNKDNILNISNIATKFKL